MNYSVLIPYLSARILISLANSILSVAIGWHLYLLTGDPFDLALVGLIQIIPILSLFIISGWVVDHFSRKRVLLACALIETMILVALANVMQGMDASSVDKSSIFLLLFAHSSARAFFTPAQDAILPNIVSRTALPNAIALASTVWNVASTSGPFIAGILIAWLNMQTYWVLALLCGSAVIFFSMIPTLTQIKPQNKDWKQVLHGIIFIKKNPILLGCLSLDLFAVLFGSVLVLLPIYVADVLQLGPKALGVLRGMPALGAVTVGLILTQMSPLKQAGRTLFTALFVFGISIIIFAFSSHYWLSMIALFLYGASDMISVNVRGTLIHLSTPDELRGRVGAVKSIFVAASNRLGDFRAGTVAAIIGPVATFALGGVMAIAVAIGGYYLFPQIRKINELADEELKQSA